MGRDLYSCDLNTLTFADVDDFVALQIKEGLRVDYKEQVPGSLGDIVAAFSNTVGGIIVLGVAETDGLPTSIPGILKARSDLKTSLTSRIVSTVYPRPLFEIGVSWDPAHPEQQVAVIRVEEGFEPPYVYLPRKISVRVEDACEAASLADLERLFGQRGVDPLERHDPEERKIYITAVGEHGRVRPDTFLRLWATPTQPQDLRLHRPFDQAVLRLVQQEFAHMDPVVIADRGASWLDLKYSTAGSEFEACWRVTQQGSIGFVAQTYFPSKNAICLLDALHSGLVFFRVANAYFEAMGWPGRVIVEGEFGVDDKSVLSEGAVSAEAVPGVVKVEGRTGRGIEKMRSTLDRASPLTAASFLVDTVAVNLRHQRNADIHYDKLMRFVEAMAAKVEAIEVQ